MSDYIIPNYQLTQNIWLHEFLRSTTARKYGINNFNPPMEVVLNLLALSMNVLQPIRHSAREAYFFTSGWRCPELNSHPKIGGSTTSDHLTGGAADGYMRHTSIFDMARIAANLSLPYDQCLLYPEKNMIHFGHRRIGNNRNEIKTRRGGRWIKGIAE